MLRKRRTTTEHSVLVKNTLALERFFVEQRLDTHATGLGAKMATQRISSGEAPPATPIATAGQLATTDEFLLAGMQTLVTFAVVLAGEGLAADGTDEGPFVGVGAQVGAEVVGAGEFLGAQGALEGGGVFLDAFGVGGRAGALRVGQVEDVVAVGDRGGGGAARGFGAGRGVARAGGVVGEVEGG